MAIHFSTTLLELFVIKKVVVPTFFRNQDVIVGWPEELGLVLKNRDLCFR
ncbi:hypothetical protein LEP1GSC172_2126 [Leptospira noguchii]|uniref:Uncharacterized protein n=1 Tax=Leptospira noguchii TaxID=28182 RepID=M6V9G0_9LEPT|nr:hypothetical protein LEP1GSC172_2126 [Leptospira noguchii]